METHVAHSSGRGTLFSCTSCSFSDKSGYRALCDTLWREIHVCLAAGGDQQRALGAGVAVLFYVVWKMSILFSFFFFCSVIWLWLSCKTEGVSGKYWMPANSKFVSLSQLVTITCIHVWENVLFVNVFRASAFVVYQVDRCHFYSSWYLLYFHHQEWPVVAAWEVRNAVKS